MLRIPRINRSTVRLARAVLLMFGIALVSGAVAYADDAWARPGGGSSFSGGSRSGSSSSGSSRSGSSSSSSGSYRSGSSSGSYSSGGGGGGGGGIVFLPILVIGIIIWLIVVRNRTPQTWSTMGGMQGPYIPPYQPPMQTESPRRLLLNLRDQDPNFSLVLFDDFLVALYTEIKIAQGRGTLARYQPYLGQGALPMLGPPGGEIHSVIVGAASIEEVHGTEPHAQRVQVKVAFDVNYSIRQNGQDRGCYAHEEWTFSRPRNARSKTPDKARVIGCPNCGAPLDVIAAGVCTHCRANVSSGGFDWVVDQIAVLAVEPRGPVLTSNTVEQGTNLPSIIAPEAAQRFAALTADDPGTTWQGLSSRIGLIFTEFQTAWAARDLAKMRPYMSDALFATNQFWVEEYKRQGLRNITENAAIASLELANVSSDAFYDAVTVRLYASSLDYTVADATNQIVSGNRSNVRRYTEYWTIIRGRAKKGPPKTDKSCPNCGAPLNITMAGVCTYCKVKVTTGDHDWVLSRIEQDESYRG